MVWPKGRPRSDEDKAQIAAAMRMTGGKRRTAIVRPDGVAEVPLRGGAIALINAEDLPLVADRSWHLHSAGYAVAGRDGHPVYMHRVILAAPDGVQVDHINRNRRDNRRQNLRLATARQQRGNQISRPGSRSRFRGVTWDNNGRCWAARVGRVWLGLHPTEERAAVAVNAELLRQFGDFARLNIL